MTTVTKEIPMALRTKIKVPKLGDTADDVLVLAWLVDVGDIVSVGDPMLTVETDKVDADVPAPVAGTVVQRLVEVDDEVPTGAVFAVIEAG